MIPVSKLLQQGKKLNLNLLIEEFMKGPVNDMFYEPPFPEGTKLLGTKEYIGNWQRYTKGKKYKGNIAVINFSKEFTNFPNGTPAQTAIFKCLEHSIFSSLDVDAVGYLINGQKVPYIGDPGRSLKPNGPIPGTKYIWLPLTFTENKQTYIVPYSTNSLFDDLSLETSLKTVVNILKNNKEKKEIFPGGFIENREGHVIQQIPIILSEKASINDIKIKEDKIIIDFNNELIKDLKLSQTNAEMFIDAIILSATEFRQIKQVVITVNGEKTNLINNLEQPLIRPRYVNVNPSYD